ncbi:uncharacterized protein LOC123450593 [Hordeum vulgare subsp. vulgare]|uniref:uncharacterized protein LOC123450593 n=1 Tax=Hordeum vulgare subsp. vulgare TaxID=112509 RepID=UPI001D1A341D|nr:uncharacterized protein LOC123450593 [Hordeum vulgare subsp. vulgare]
MDEPELFQSSRELLRSSRDLADVAPSLRVSHSSSKTMRAPRQSSLSGEITSTSLLHPLLIEPIAEVGVAAAPLLERRICSRPSRGTDVLLLPGASSRSTRTRRLVLVPLVASPWPEVPGADWAIADRAPRSSYRKQEEEPREREGEKGWGTSHPPAGLIKSTGPRVILSGGHFMQCVFDLLKTYSKKDAFIFTAAGRKDYLVNIRWLGHFLPKK